MSLYRDLLEQGTDRIEDYLDVVEKQLAKSYSASYKAIKAQLADFTATGLEDANKYNRLKNLLTEMSKEVKKSINYAKALTEDTSANSVLDAFETFWYSYENTYEQVAFGILPVDAIRNSVYSQVSGADFATRYGKLYTGTIDKIAETITRGIATGQSYTKTASEMKDLFNNLLWQSDRVVRTESHRCWQDGSTQAYERAKEKGIDGERVWLSTRDGRTRPDHARMNGVAVNKKDGLFHTPWGKVISPGYGPASETINCRCDSYYRIEGTEKNETPNWTWEQWREEFGQKKKL